MTTPNTPTTVGDLVQLVGSKQQNLIKHRQAMAEVARVAQANKGKVKEGEAQAT